jgi:hypothetical protein
MHFAIVYKFTERIVRVFQSGNWKCIVLIKSLIHSAEPSISFLFTDYWESYDIIMQEVCLERGF